jgi:hypothetical protein
LIKYLNKSSEGFEKSTKSFSSNLIKVLGEEKRYKLFLAKDRSLRVKNGRQFMAIAEYRIQGTV